MKTALVPVAATASVLFAAIVACAGPAQAQTAPAAAMTVEKAARGKYLVATSGCMDCHTPWKMGPKGPEPDMSRWLSGHPQDVKMPPAPVLSGNGAWQMVAAATNTAFAGPWGVSFTANLTPDKETGLGDWTVDDFKKTIRTGRHLGRGREILPPMPIPVYNNMTDDDLEAVFAYLRTIPAINNRVPEPWAPTVTPAAK
jgi:hypothetical protein